MRHLLNSRLADLSRACDPNVPADENTFTPLNEARGSSLFADIVLGDLRYTKGKRKWLFSGHIGCGKSSELYEVARVVRAEEEEGKRYLPVFVDMRLYADLLYITPEAVQLAIVAELADTLRLLPGGGIKLQTNYFTNLFNDILDLLRTPLEASELEIGLAGVKAKFKYAYRSPSVRERLQSVLRPKTADLLESLNALFADAKRELEAYGLREAGLPYDDFLVIVDSLDRVQKVPDAEIGLASHERLFLDNSIQFTALEAHIIFTVPIVFARTSSTRLENLYGNKPYVLPMVKVFTRDEHAVYPAGYAALEEMVRRRMGGQNLNDFIDADSFRYLVANTGGYVREFVAGIGTAARNAKGTTITIGDAEKVIADNYASYENGIKKEWLPDLLALKNDPLYRVDIENKSVLEMLESHYILEYRNGLSDVDNIKSNTITQVATFECVCAGITGLR